MRRTLHFSYSSLLFVKLENNALLPGNSQYYELRLLTMLTKLVRFESIVQHYFIRNNERNLL